MQKEIMQQAVALTTASLQNKNFGTDNEEIDYIKSFLPKVYYGLIDVITNIERNNADAVEIAKKQLIEETIIRYPNEVRETQETLKGLVGIYGACLIVKQKVKEC